MVAEVEDIHMSNNMEFLSVRLIQLLPLLNVYKMIAETDIGPQNSTIILAA